MKLFGWSSWPLFWSASLLDIGDSDWKATKESVRVKTRLCSPRLSLPSGASCRHTATWKSVEEERRAILRQYTVLIFPAFLIFSFRCILCFAHLRYLIVTYILFEPYRGASGMFYQWSVKYRHLPYQCFDIHCRLLRYIRLTRIWKILTRSIWIFSTRTN